MFALFGQAPVNVIVLLTRATLPAPAAIAIAPLRRGWEALRRYFRPLVARGSTVPAIRRPTLTASWTMWPQWLRRTERTSRRDSQVCRRR